MVSCGVRQAGVKSGVEKGTKEGKEVFIESKGLNLYVDKVSRPLKEEGFLADPARVQDLRREAQDSDLRRVPFGHSQTSSAPSFLTPRRPSVCARSTMPSARRWSMFPTLRPRRHLLATLRPLRPRHALRSHTWQTQRVRRIYDAKRDTLVYVAHVQALPSHIAPWVRFLADPARVPDL